MPLLSKFLLTACIGCSFGSAYPETALSNINIPKNFHLQCYEDCGVAGRQKYVRDAVNWVFSPSQVSGTAVERSVSFGNPHLIVQFDDLKPEVPYILVITYVTEKGSQRIQKLYAGEKLLHDSLILPEGTPQKFQFALDADCFQDGKLELKFINESGPNAVVSLIELWAPLPPKSYLYVEKYRLGEQILSGKVLDIRFEPVNGASVFIENASSGVILDQTKTDSNGIFSFPNITWVKGQHNLKVCLRVQSEKTQFTEYVPLHDWLLVLPEYVPIPVVVSGVQQTEKLLDGTWKLCVDPKPGSELKSALTEWNDFTVPGQWLQSGFTVPDGVPVGMECEFEIPSDWSNKPVYLRFDAVHGKARYWLNGNLLGESDLLFCPVEFEISGFLKVGSANRLYIQMTSDKASLVERLSHSSTYAFHNLGGIPRSVRVFVKPQTHLKHAMLQTGLDELYQDGTLQVDLKITPSQEDQWKDLELQLTLEDASGQKVVIENPTIPLEWNSLNDTPIHLKRTVPSPIHWNHEKPHLYSISLSLANRQEILETIQWKAGFRRIDIAGTQILLNGKPIKLAGVNRHEIDPLTGRAATAIHAENDVKLFRSANVNYIRTSHYPPTREFLDACDRLGMLVEVEAPFCWTRQGVEENDPIHAWAWLLPSAAMVDYHFHHPSILLWSLGNESGNVIGSENRLPTNYKLSYDLVRKKDPSRPTCFNNEWGLDGGVCEVVVAHYPPGEFETQSYVADATRPVLFDEYLHNHCYNIDELRMDPAIREEWALEKFSFGAPGFSSHWDESSIWNRIYRSDKVAGGAIWAGIDEVFLFGNRGSAGYGPWGIIDGWRRCKPEWWLTKCLYSPIWIPTRTLDFSGEEKFIEIPIENRYQFTSLDEQRLEWHIENKTGSMSCPSIGPRKKGILRFPVPENTSIGSLLVLHFLDHQNHLIGSYGLDLGPPPKVNLPQVEAGCPNHSMSEDELYVYGNNYQFILNKLTGEITSPVQKQRVLFEKFPHLFLRQKETKSLFNPNGFPFQIIPDDKTRVIKSVDLQPTGKNLTIKVTEEYEKLHGSTTMTLDCMGHGTLDFDYQYNGETFPVGEMGLAIPVSSSCNHIQWKRRGVWGWYPEGEILRNEGEVMFEDGRVSDYSNGLAAPKVEWSEERNEMGSNDWRGTKWNIEFFKVTDGSQNGLCIVANRDRHARIQKTEEGQLVYLLVGEATSQIEAGNRLRGDFSFIIQTGPDM